MRTLFLPFLTCLLCFTLLVNQARPVDLSPEERAKVALALISPKAATGKKVSSCGCACTTGLKMMCVCSTGECSDPACCTANKKAPRPLEWVIYERQYNLAIQQNKPLLIWVGETCPSCESKWTQYIHARLSEYDGKNGTETGPEVIVARPDGLGGMSIAGRLEGIPSATAVSGLLNPAPQRTTQAAPMVYVPPPMPMMPMMGGFGGGMMMGGGFGGSGGGGC